MKPAIEIETLWAILSAITKSRLGLAEFLDLAESDIVDDLLKRPADFVRYLESWDVRENCYPMGADLLRQRTGGGKNDKHAAILNPKELKRWNDMIDGWERQIIDLKRSQDEGRKRKIKKLKNKIRDAKETVKFQGEQHSQRDKGYNIPGFHDSEGLDDDDH